MRVCAIFSLPFSNCYPFDVLVSPSAAHWAQNTVSNPSSQYVHLLLCSLLPAEHNFLPLDSINAGRFCIGKFIFPFFINLLILFLCSQVFHALFPHHRQGGILSVYIPLRYAGLRLQFEWLWYVYVICISTSSDCTYFTCCTYVDACTMNIFSIALPFCCHCLWDFRSG